MKPVRRFTVRAMIMVLALCAALSGCKSLLITAGSGDVGGAMSEIGKNTVKAFSNTGKAIASIAEDITPEQEYYIGRAVAANILKTYSLWRGSPALTAYLNRICSAIVINSPRPDIYNGYHVAILDSNEINAFATSGGHIFITRGLITVANSEDALAAVIAHEVAHIQLQHSIKAIKTSRVTNAFMVTGASVTGVVSGYDVDDVTSLFNDTVGDIVGTLVNNGYSQAQEFNADSTALSLLAEAGYNASGLAEMLKELEKVQKNDSGGFSKTHPSPASRLASVERTLAKQPELADNSSYRRARFAANTK